MRICIIGGSGYIGSYLTSKLSLDNTVDVFDIKSTVVNLKGGDIPDTVIQDYDIIIYLAGLSTRVACIKNDKDVIFVENVEDIMAVGKKMLPTQLLIYASSASILEGSKQTPVNENYEVQLDLLDPYATSMYNRECNIKKLEIPTIGLRFGTVIGISRTQRLDLIHIAMLRSAYMMNMITVQNPLCSRAILWIEDLYNAINTIIQNRPSIGHHIYHLASFNDTVEGVAKAISAHTDICITTDKNYDEIGGFSLDTTRFEKEFSFEFKGTNDVIIKQLIENISSLCSDNQSLTLKCRVCSSENTVTILDMGTQPLANNYVHRQSVQAEYPLCLIRCPECFHTQLNYVVKPEVMFRNYQYNSGTSSTLCKYFEYLTDKIIVDTKIEKGIILELACNDGSQLDYFKEKGWQTYGVDPAENIIKIGREKGHQIYSGFWGKDKFVEIPTPDVILAQNVLAHVPDPIAFLTHCAKEMGTHTFLYIQTSQCNMYANGEFDTIYHEHLSFFTIASMMKAASSCGLSIVDVSKQPIHGTSYLFQMRIGSEHSQAVYEMMNAEKSIGLYSDVFYEAYKNRVEDIKQWVGTTLKGFVDKNITVIGYGAAAKGMTLLNYFDIQNVEYIIDDATMKHNKYTPGKNILILPPSKLALDERPLAVFVFAWNFIDEITNKIKSYRNDKPTFIIQSFPFQTVVEL